MKFVIEHLSKSFEKKEVLRDIDFTFDEGKIYGLLGRNGAGKTTLFNCLNRDLKADSGNFYIEDENGVRREVSAEDIGYVLSTPTVPEFLTGREFLKFFMDINEKSIKNPKSIDEYFDYMSIEPEDRDKLLKDYSHGMKNKMQMLINITQYSDKAYCEEHPYIELETADGLKAYKVFAVVCLKKTDLWYNISCFESKEHYQKAITEIKDRSLYDTGIEPQFKEQLITLSTCFGDSKDSRIVVIGVEQIR